MDELNVVATETTETAVEPTEPVNAEPNKDEKPVDPEIEKLKRLLSKANSEANNYKQQLREKQTEAERAEAERLEREQAMQTELETLRKDKAISEYTNKALAIGFDAETAALAANAMADGDMNAVFDALKAFVEATTKRITNEALNKQPGLSTGTPPTTNTTDPDLENMRRWAGLPPR